MQREPGFWSRRHACGRLAFQLPGAAAGLLMERPAGSPVSFATQLRYGSSAKPVGKKKPGPMPSLWLSFWVFLRKQNQLRQ